MIPLYSNNASESATQLHEIVSKILQSNHEISIQLRELIKRNEEGADIRPPINQPNAEHDNESATPDFLKLTPASSTTDFDDNASFKSAVSSFSIRSMSRSMSSLSLPSFTEDLLNSRAYKRARYFRRGGGSSSESVISFTKGDTWSMLSDMSLGGLSISEISVLDLPICLSDLHDPTPFEQAPATMSNQRRGLLNVNWSSRGRLHSAASANNLFALRTLINLGADIKEVDSNGDTLLLCLMKAQEGYFRVSDRFREFDMQAMPILSLLLDNGASVNSTDSTGRTPLSYAAGNEQSWAWT